MRLNSLYVNVDDMGRALRFYRELFQATPTQEQERYSIFEAGGVDFGLYNARFDGETTRAGNNCIPNLEVRDVDAEHRRISRFAPRIDPQVSQVEDYRYFECEDTEGNILEVYQMARGM